MKKELFELTTFLLSCVLHGGEDSEGEIKN